jgi:hypothetical protein
MDNPTGREGDSERVSKTSGGQALSYVYGGLQVTGQEAARTSIIDRMRDQDQGVFGAGSRTCGDLQWWSVLDANADAALAAAPPLDVTVVDVFLLELESDQLGGTWDDLSQDDKQALFQATNRACEVRIGTNTKGLGILRRLLLRLSPTAWPIFRSDLFDEGPSGQGPLSAALSWHGDRLAVALSRGLPVEISLQAVPKCVDGYINRVLTHSERLWLANLPAAARSEGLARLWTRKDAGLRLAGFRRFDANLEMLALICCMDGRVVVPVPDGNTFQVNIFDLPRRGDYVATIASAGEPMRIRLWLLQGVAVA